MVEWQGVSRKDSIVYWTSSNVCDECITVRLNVDDDSCVVRCGGIITLLEGR